MNGSACHAAEIIVHLARLAQNGGGRFGLTPAQWTALRFFARANRLSRTPSAFSAFHATTRGTASQTVKSLVALGLLERHRNEGDGRSIRFELTPAGLAALEEDPLHALTRQLESLPCSERERFLATLQKLSGALAESRETAVFGTCSDCAHCEGDGAREAYCRCASTMLKLGEMDSLCVEFRPRPVQGA